MWVAQRQVNWKKIELIFGIELLLNYSNFMKTMDKHTELTDIVIECMDLLCVT